MVPRYNEAAQNLLDRERQRVADETSWKETVRENIAGVE